MPGRPVRIPRDLLRDIDRAREVLAAVASELPSTEHVQTARKAYAELSRSEAVQALLEQVLHARSEYLNFVREAEDVDEVDAQLGGAPEFGDIDPEELETPEGRSHLRTRLVTAFKFVRGALAFLIFVANTPEAVESVVEQGQRVLGELARIIALLSDGE